MKPVDDQFFIKRKKKNSFHALQKERLPWSLLKGIIMQLSFLLDSMLSKLTLSCIVSTRAPNRQLYSQPPLRPWAHGQSVCVTAVYHTGPDFGLRGQKEKSSTVLLCLRGPESCNTQISRLLVWATAFLFQILITVCMCWKPKWHLFLKLVHKIHKDVFYSVKHMGKNHLFWCSIW